jgi:hypothetical protein
MKAAVSLRRIILMGKSIYTRVLLTPSLLSLPGTLNSSLRPQEDAQNLISIKITIFSLPPLFFKQCNSRYLKVLTSSHPANTPSYFHYIFYAIRSRKGLKIPEKGKVSKHIR